MPLTCSPHSLSHPSLLTPTSHIPLCVVRLLPVPLLVGAVVRWSVSSASAPSATAGGGSSQALRVSHPLCHLTLVPFIWMALPNVTG